MFVRLLLPLLLLELMPTHWSVGQEKDFTATKFDLSTSTDPLRDWQLDAVTNQYSDMAHWGRGRAKYVSWSQHSNRLIPVYTFGITLDAWRDRGSPYADPTRLQALYGQVPTRTYNPVALYHDQTDVYRLQQQAYDAGCKHIIMLVFDGTDWMTTRTAAIYNDPVEAMQASGASFRSGRGSGLSFMDYRGAPTDFGFVVTSPFSKGGKYDIDAQIVSDAGSKTRGGYDVVRGGSEPWLEQSDQDYLMGVDREVDHAVTDSASSATSIFSGIKTYNSSINVAPDGSQVIPMARTLQEKGWKVGLVTSVPVSHATPAAAYANNVTRSDYQDLARDLIGLPSSSHRETPLPGVDVLIGGGFGVVKAEESSQGGNFAQGNPYIHERDVAAVTDAGDDTKYVLAAREAGQSGRERLMAAADEAVQSDMRLLGLYGVDGGHLPFRTADGQYDPTAGLLGAESYTEADVRENPTLADMTAAALRVLEKSSTGFYLMVEAGDVDWANHVNNLDNSIGAVISGDQAFRVITDWVEQNNAWESTAVIVTADHGHFLVLDDDVALAAAARRAAAIAAEKSN